MKERKNRFARKSTQEIVTVCIVTPILFIWALSLLYPFFWATMNTFKTPSDFLRDSFAFPKEWHFENWVDAFRVLKVQKTNLSQADMVEMIINSIWWMVGQVSISTFVTLLASYAIAKYPYKFGKFLYLFNIVIMAIPIVGSMPAQYSLYHSLKIVNSPFMLLISAGCLGSSALMIYYSYFQNISWSYAEAVFIDGGGHWTVFFKIMLPQAMPITSAMVIIACIGSWNDYFTPLIYLADYPTLATGLYKMSAESTTAQNKPMYFAAVLLSAIPMFVIFMIFQEKIMTSVSIGGLKG